MNKSCKRCRIEYPLEFFRDTKTRAGNITKIPYCKECSRFLSNESYKRNYKKQFPFIADLPGEKWVKIKLFSGKYMASSNGRIKRCGYFAEKKNGYKCFHQECLIKQCLNQGYLYVSLYGTRANSYKVHRLIAQSFIENPNNYPQVNHIDGNKQNNNIENLEWCTNTQNNHHARLNGLMVTGKLSPEQVVEIFNSKDKTSALAKKYKVNDSSIQEIRNGKTWSWLTGKYNKVKRVSNW